MFGPRYLPVIFIALIFTVMGNAQENEGKKHGFIGAEACGVCHKSEKQGKQLDIWKNSRHAKAYETLKSEKANEIASKLGYNTSAANTPECLKCHASGYDVDASLIGKKFKVEDGVQCETCHGAGADYKDMKIMKSREESIKNGLIIHEEKEKFCIGCHNTESPTFVNFDFEEQWAKIQHNKPVEK